MQKLKKAVVVGSCVLGGGVLYKYCHWIRSSLHVTPASVYQLSIIHDIRMVIFLVFSSHG